MSVVTLTLNGELVSAREGETLLQTIRERGIDLPTLCHLDGISERGGCRLCVVDLAGARNPVPACVTTVQEGMVIETHTDTLRDYRKMILELLFAERNHVCAVCVVNGNCELQTAAAEAGMDHIRFDYLHPDLPMDASHDRFVLDHNRCILCTRCVRVCTEIEGAHTWDVMSRGIGTRVITDLNTPWGDSDTCTSCGKCVQACPTGALFHKGSSVSEMEKQPNFLKWIVSGRERHIWEQ
jgi:bidirectional [NiFe] hydrogenase diaphorase subunit